MTKSSKEKEIKGKKLKYLANRARALVLAMYEGNFDIYDVKRYSDGETIVIAGTVSDGIIPFQEIEITVDGRGVMEVATVNSTNPYGINYWD